MSVCRPCARTSGEVCGHHSTRWRCMQTLREMLRSLTLVGIGKSKPEVAHFAKIRPDQGIRLLLEPGRSAHKARSVLHLSCLQKDNVKSICSVFVDSDALFRCHRRRKLWPLISTDSPTGTQNHARQAIPKGTIGRLRNRTCIA